jgi:8-oxo-dGTP pyrophosphatase MutT (NUDIX family)
VILLRDGPEVFLLRRVRAMAFAPGAYVFPGGSVDPADGDPADAADAADAEPVDSDPADGDPVAIRGRWRQRQR